MEYHIVYGEVGENQLLFSGLINTSSAIQRIVRLQDNLDTGYLYNIKTLEGIEARVNWFKKFFSNIYVEDETRLLLARENNIRLSDITAEDTVYIWLGNDCTEYLWKLAVFYFLDNTITCYAVDWSKVWVQNKSGETKNLMSLSLSAVEHIDLVKKSFQLVPLDQKIAMGTQWENLLKGNAEMRIFNKNLQIEEVPVSYYDGILLQYCSDDFQTSSYIVSYSLIYFWNNIGTGTGDGFLFERLYQLVLMGVLESRNHVQEKYSKHIFEVRKVK